MQSFNESIELKCATACHATSRHMIKRDVINANVIGRCKRIKDVDI